MSPEEHREIDPRIHSLLRIGYRIFLLSGGILAVLSLLNVVVFDGISTAVLALSAFALAFLSTAGKMYVEGRTIRTALWVLVAVVLGIVTVDPYSWDIVGPVTVIMAVLFFGWLVVEVADGLGLSNDDELTLQPPDLK